MTDDDDLAAVRRRHAELQAELLAWHRKDPIKYPLPPEMVQQGDWTWMWAGDVPDDVSELVDGNDYDDD